MLMKVKDAAPRLGISMGKLYQLIRSGAIPYQRIGKKGFRVDPLVILEMGKYDPNAKHIYHFEGSKE